MNLFLTLLDKTGRIRTIMDRDSKEPYLIRHYLFLKDRKYFPFNIFLHKFLRSDPDDLHDHPWPYFTFILKGGYWEWIPIYNEVKVITGEKRVWRGPGHFRICKADSYHRIEIEPTVDCWTLFIPGPHKREWGFLTHTNWLRETQEWIKHDEYIDRRKNV
jgi:hypothetical protein